VADSILEVCVDNTAGLEAALAGGADRIELCSALALGGLTPSAGFMALAAQAPVPVYAMIRPRGGDFVYDAADVEQMCVDIRYARTIGLKGVVLGAMHADGRLAQEQLAVLVEAAIGMDLTLHRVVDVLTEPVEIWLEAAIALSFKRVLTSGGETSAIAGLARLRQLFALADGRIIIMPGAGVTAENVGLLTSELGVAEMHASCSSQVVSASAKVQTLGFVSVTDRQTDPALVRALKTALRDGLAGA
jgi:copper homeostasis protein